MTLIPRLSALLALSLTAPLVAQRTWIVDFHGGAGVDFTDIAPAIAAATAGDRIEVYGATPIGPTYPPFVVAKTLDVEAMQGARVAYFHVENLPAGSSVHIAGFRCEPAPTYFTPDDCVLLRNSAGSVLLTGLDVTARSGDPVDGFIVRNTAAVAIQDCSARGRDSGLVHGGAGLVVDSSGVSLVRTTLTGGDGGSSASSAAGYDGGVGLVVLSGSVSCAMGTVAGGQGAYGWAVPGNGGDAVRVASGGTALFAACTITRGARSSGASLDGDAIDGAAEVTVDCGITGALVNGASIVPSRPMLSSDPETPLGGRLGLVIAGAPGDFFALALDVNHEHHVVPWISGPFLLTSTFVVVGQGILAGSVAFNVQIPVLPILHQRDVHFQVVTLGAAGAMTLSPLAVTRLR